VFLQAAQQAVKEAESALASARQTADAVRSKGGLGGRGKTRVGAAAAAANNKGTQLWSELAEIAHNLVSNVVHAQTSQF